MQRLLWWVGGNILVLGILAGAAWLWFRPVVTWPFSPDRSVMAYLSSEHVTVSYEPGESSFLVMVRLDNLGRHRQVQYHVTSSETWAPQWQARMEGQLSEFLTLHDGYGEAPAPMTRELAEKLARSYRVVLRYDGADETLDFSTAGISESVRRFSICWDP